MKKVKSEKIYLMHKKWCQNAVQSQIIGTQRLRINSPFANNYRIQCITLLAHWKYYQFSFPSMELYLLLKIISKHPKMFIKCLTFEEKQVLFARAIPLLLGHCSASQYG